MTKTAQYSGRCFCGAVEISLTGDPLVMAYCHCDSCRHWSAGPVSAFTLWAPDQFRVTKGAEHLDLFDRLVAPDGSPGTSIRQWCKICGGHVFIEHPSMGVVDVPAPVIDKFDFTPGFHVHYRERVLPMADGLPKFRDLPAEAGGSGEQLDE